jgi:hypothetical protein
MAKTIQTCDGVTFGEGLTYSSIQEVDYNLSNDKKAFTVTLQTGLAAGVGSPVYDGLVLTGAPVNTRIYSVVIPATGENLKTTFVLNGFGLTELGTNTKLVLTVNDQHSVTYFGPREDQAFTVLMPFQAEAVTDVRITVLVIAECDSTHPDATALIVLNDVSADARVTESQSTCSGSKKF